MKKCPTCDKTYENSMRFCQIDGTSLVDDAPAFDPYATIVGRVPVPQNDPAPVPPTPREPEPESPIHATVGSIPIAEPNDVLDLPSSDPLKTMYVSDSEMRDALGKSDQPDIIDIPPIESEPPPPSFIASEPDPPAGATPPPSPFGTSTPPGPSSSPFDERPQFNQGESPITAPPSFNELHPPRFDEAATMMQPNFNQSFEQSKPELDAAAPWAPAPVAEQSWQNPAAAYETPGQPPVAGADGSNKTLAVASLVLSLLSFLCLGLLGSIPAIILGFMQKSKIKANPSEFGGGGFATAGIVLGVLNIIVTIVVVILYAGLIMANMR